MDGSTFLVGYNFSEPRTKKVPMQRYFSQPREDGKYCVAMKRLDTGELVEMVGEVYLTETESMQRAKELNEDYNEQLKTEKS